MPVNDFRFAGAFEFAFDVKQIFLDNRVKFCLAVKYAFKFGNQRADLVKFFF